MPNVIADHIALTPGVCGGRPRIAGSRIRVQDVAILHERLGRTPDEIVAAHPQLSLADVHAALAYYFDHRDEIRRMIAEDEAFVEDLKAKTPSKLAAAEEYAALDSPLDEDELRRREQETEPVSTAEVWRMLKAFGNS